jgi:hypothetical protein
MVFDGFCMFLFHPNGFAPHHIRNWKAEVNFCTVLDVIVFVGPLLPSRQIGPLSKVKSPLQNLPGMPCSRAFSSGDGLHWVFGQ